MQIFFFPPQSPIFSLWSNAEILELNFVLLVQKKEVGMGCKEAMKRCKQPFFFQLFLTLG